MALPLTGLQVAILATGGFDELQMSDIQRELVKAGATTKTIAPENGVMHGWQGNGWGHYFPVNSNISEALGSDFDVLVIPGGERATTKLKTNAHARRIINHFFDAQKPIAAIGTGVSLLTLSPRIAGHEVSAPESVKAEMEAATAEIIAETVIQSGRIVTANGEDTAAWVELAMQVFTAEHDANQQAQAAA